MRYLKYLVSISLIAFSIIGIISIYTHFNPLKSHTEVSSAVLLERVEKVIKLTTVEGNFSEIYNYKDHIVADIWPLRKKALVRVNATVAVGFNFEEVVITIDETDKIVKIDKMPAPEVLSIDHDIDYYNFENGIFNMINNKDITDMGAKAKDFIEQKALESDLLAQATTQRNELFEILALAIQGAGWKLELEGKPLKG